MTRPNDWGDEYPGDTTDVAPTDPITGRAEQNYAIRTKTTEKPTFEKTYTKTTNQIQDNAFGNITKVLSSGYCYVGSILAYLGQYSKFRQGDPVYLMRCKAGIADWVVVGGPEPYIYYEPPTTEQLAASEYQDNAQPDNKYYLDVRE